MFVYPWGVSVQEGDLCPGGESLSRGISLQGVSIPGVICLGGSVWEVSVQWGLCPDGVSVRRLSRGGGVSVRETPHMVKSVRYASYWNAFLFNLSIVPTPRPIYFFTFDLCLII